MALQFPQGFVLGPSDLSIVVRDFVGTTIDPFAITYSLFDVSSGIPIQVGPSRNSPTRKAIGEYYVNETLPVDGQIGPWKVVFFIQETVDSVEVTVELDFNLVGPGTSVTGFLATLSQQERTLVTNLRVLLRDLNPDRDYHFRPPIREQVVAGFSERIGYIWTDFELLVHLGLSLNLVNLTPPRNLFANIATMPPEWSTVLLMGGAFLATKSLATNWVADEFSISYNSLIELSVNSERIKIKIGDLYKICKEV